MKSGVGSQIAFAHALLTAMAFALGAVSEERAGSDDLDEESDSAAFAVVVEHVGAGAGAGVWRCAAALVSLRTALTSARCALGEGAEWSEVWARAPQPAGAASSRVVRVALAAGAELDAGPGRAWAARAGAASRDVALLELASALAGARPILLASTRADCEPGPACYIVRSLGSGRGSAGGLRLRIAELSLRPARACWEPPAALPVLEHRALCLAGPRLCQSEAGAGVVCGGKLCGVLSGSRGADADPEGCGTPHAAAAASAPRWRRFLHCALTRGACGRDGECARLCSERWLVQEPAPSLIAPATAPAAALLPTAMVPTGSDREDELPTRTAFASEADGYGRSVPTMAMPTRSPPASRVLPSPSQPPSPPPKGASTARHAHEFEPNRADFTMRPARPTRVVFKAGEYGDNAAAYAAPLDDSAPKVLASSSPPAPPAPPSRHSPLPPPPPMEPLAAPAPTSPAPEFELTLGKGVQPRVGAVLTRNRPSGPASDATAPPYSRHLLANLMCIFSTICML